IRHRLRQHARGMAQHDAALAQRGQRIGVDAHRDAGHHAQGWRPVQHRRVQPEAGTDHALDPAQRLEERLALVFAPGIGPDDLVLGPDPLQLGLGQVAIDEDGLAWHGETPCEDDPAGYSPASCSKVRVGRPSVSPGTCTARAPIQAPRTTARSRGRPSSRPLITPTAKPSPAPTVSTTRSPGWAGTRPLRAPASYYAPPGPSLTTTSPAPLPRPNRAIASGSRSPVSRRPSSSPGSTQSARPASSLMPARMASVEAHSEGLRLVSKDTVLPASRIRRMVWRDTSKLSADTAANTPVACRCRADSSQSRSTSSGRMRLAADPARWYSTRGSLPSVTR